MRGREGNAGGSGSPLGHSCRRKGWILLSSAFPAGPRDVPAARMSPGQGRGRHLLPTTSSRPCSCEELNSPGTQGCVRTRKCPCTASSSPGPALIVASRDVWGTGAWGCPCVELSSRGPARIPALCTLPKILPGASPSQAASHHPREPVPALSFPRGMLGEGHGAPRPDPPAAPGRVSAGARWQARLLEFDFQINHKPG